MTVTARYVVPEAEMAAWPFWNNAYVESHVIISVEAEDGREEEPAAPRRFHVIGRPWRVLDERQLQAWAYEDMCGDAPANDASAEEVPWPTTAEALDYLSAAVEEVK